MIDAIDKEYRSTNMQADPQLLLCDRLPRAAQIKFALSTAAVMLAALVATLPFARLQLPGSESALPAYATAILINDGLTAALLFALYSAHPKPGLLCLAIGYLLVGLLAVPWVMTFPGVFADNGLLDAGQQTTAAIAAIRRCGFPFFVLAYALLRGVNFSERNSRFWASWWVITGAFVFVCAAAICATALIIAYDQSMPKLMAGRMEASSLWSYVAGGSVVLYVAAIGALVTRPRSVLDLWLLVVLFALLIEIVLLSFISSGRLSVGWWVGRGFGLAAASIVLFQMMWETTALHAHLVRSVASERRATEMRLISLQALSASIAHELNQPLASMVTNADAGLLWLRRPQPDLAECKGAFDRIATEGHRAGKVIESIRTLFQKNARERVTVDMNDIISDLMPELRRYAHLNGASLHVDLTSDLPPIDGNVVQLQQVVSSLPSRLQMPTGNCCCSSHTSPGRQARTIQPFAIYR